MAFTLLLDDRSFFLGNRRYMRQFKKKLSKSPRLKFSRIKTDGLSLLNSLKLIFAQKSHGLEDICPDMN